MNGLNLNIKRLRKNFPYTQEEMAEKLNLSVGAYKKIENGITKLDIDRLNQISKL
jgi:transcriptional regulator with XRE-family HTH domain